MCIRKSKDWRFSSYFRNPEVREEWNGEKVYWNGIDLATVFKQNRINGESDWLKSEKVNEANGGNYIMQN